MHTVKCGLVFFLLLLLNKAYTQNLVPDPGFEIANCDNYPQLEFWVIPNTATPDVITISGCGVQLTDDLIDLGYSQPFEGNQYAGLFCCYPTDSEVQTREYLSTRMISSLESGMSYKVSFRIRRLTYFDLGIDKIGIYFSESTPLSDDALPLEVEPQLETSGEILQPDTFWQYVEFDYIATGSEQFLTIGCFRWPAEMSVVETGTSPKDVYNAYYFFDDLRVEQVNSVKEFDFDHLTVYYDNNQIIVVNATNVMLEYEFFDSEGRVIERNKLQSGNQIFQAPQVSNGVVLLRVYGGSHSKTYKLFIQNTR